MQLKRQFFRPGRRIEQIGKIGAHPFFSREPVAPDSTARRKPLLSRLAENFGALFSIVVSAVLIVAVVALVFAFAREIRRDEMQLAGFSAPKELADRGYTSSVIAEHVLEEIRTIQIKSPTSRARRQLGSDSALPDIQVAGGGLSMKAVVRYARRLLGMPDNRIDGELLQDGATLRLAMRIREGGQAKALAVQREDGDVEGLLKDAGRAIVQFADPYVLASYLMDNEPDKKQFPETLAAIDYVLKNPPASDDAWAYNLLGLIRARQDNNAAALEAYRRALAIDPELRVVHGNYVDALIKAGKDAEAASYVSRRSAQARSADEQTQVYGMNHALGRWDQMIRLAQLQVQAEPGKANGYNLLAHALVHAHRPAEAIAAADQGLAIDAANPDILFWRSRALCDAGRAAEALEAADVAVAVATTPLRNRSPRMARALALGALGRHDEAMAEYENVRTTAALARELSPEWGEVLLAAGHAQEAAAYYAPRLKDDSRYWPLQVGAARVDLALGHPAEAAQRFDMVAKGDPDDASLRRDWAKALEALGHPADAVAKRAEAATIEARLKVPLPLK